MSIGKPKLALCLALVIASPCAAARAVPMAGTATRGGLVEGTKVIHVTSLADDGPGSLRAALDQPGPRVIVFDVGGTIMLQSDLKIRQPFVTIAGQTAPDPGIELRGGSLRVHHHDVVIEHIAVRPGPSPSAKINDNRDAISIDGQNEGASYNVMLENVSASWSVDETVSAWFATTHAVTIRNSIIAEALRFAGHPKGRHSMALLVGTDVHDVAITGNLLAANEFRNPVIARGGSAFVANNYVNDPGLGPIHFYSHGKPTANGGPSIATVLNNVVAAGLDSRKDLPAVQFPRDMAQLSSDSAVFLDGNVLKGGGGPTVANPDGFVLTTSPPIGALDWTVMPTDKVPDYVLRYAGSRPAARDPVDAGLVAAVRAGQARVIDRPEDAPGFQPAAPTRAVSQVPANPMAPATGLRKSRLEAWLCLRHREVGGPPTPQCSEDIDSLRKAITAAP